MISLVLPVFNEAATLPQFYRRLADALLGDPAPLRGR